MADFIRENSGLAHVNNPCQSRTRWTSVDDASDRQLSATRRAPHRSTQRTMPPQALQLLSHAGAEATADDARETLARRLQNVPATANCTMSPLKRIMETAPASISAQRKAAGHRGIKGPVNMENSLTLAEAACRHKSKNALPTLCTGAHCEHRPAADWRDARFAIRGMSRHLQNSPVTTIFTISSFNKMMAAAITSVSPRRMVAAVRGIRRNTGTSFALAKVACGLSK
jgi:hypothetical protein